MRNDRICGRPKWFDGALLLGALITTVIAGCSLKSPSAPSWEVEFNLPLLNQWFEITDLIDEDEFVPFGADSIYAINFEQSLEKIEVGGDITLDDMNQSISQTIGTFSVPVALPQTTSMSLVDLGGPGNSGGLAVPIPALTFPSVTDTIPAFGAFTRVVIDTGTISVSVTNNTKVDFTTLVVRLLDAGAADALIVSLDVTAAGTLDDGSSRSVSEPLDGKTIGNNLKAEIVGSTAAADSSVILDGSESISIQVTVGEMRVSSATAVIGEIDFDYYPTISITDASAVESAVLSAGSFTLTLDNQLSIPLDLTIELPNITDNTGTPVNLNPLASAGAQGSDSRNLADHTLTPDDDGSGGKELGLTVNVYSPGSSGGLVTLSSTDAVTVQAAITGLVMQAVTGVLDSTGITIPQEQFEVASDNGNFLDEARKFDLTSVELELTIRHNIDFPADIQLNLIGEGGIPDPVQLNLSFHIDPSGFSPTGPADTTMVSRVYTLTDMNETEANLLAFINAFPTTITSSGSASIGDGSYLGSISSYSSFQADLYFNTPLSFNVTEELVFELDKEFNDEGLASGDETSLDIQEVTLTYTIASTMGLPLTVSMMVATDSALVYTDPDVELVLVVRASSAANQDTVITLTSEQWELLQQPFYSGVRIVIPPTGGTPFRLAKNDSLFMKAFVTIKALINPEGDGAGGGR